MKVLVVGASGVVGYAAVKHFASDAAWQVVGVSRRIPPDLGGATLASLDLLDAGAPANPNGTINLVWYGAWLVREMASRGA